MRRVALRGLLARKTRLALTALSVALGVMLIAGTYVLTDTINKSFDAIFQASYRHTDIVLSPNKDLTDDNDNPPPLDASVADAVKKVPGVDVVSGAIFDSNALLLKDNGKPVSKQAPSFVAALRTDRRFDAMHVVDGRLPVSDDEVVLDKATADKEHWKVGHLVSLQSVAPRKQFKLVGIATISGVDSLGGASISLMLLPEAQRMTGKQGKFDEIDVAVDKGADVNAVRDQIARSVPRGVEVRTGSQEAASQSKDIRDNLSFINIALLAFAGISLFVGAFIIFNTFSITVAQRAREFALLRTMGASRRQVMRSVLTEGFVIGALGSLAGLGLGIVVASGLRALFKALGIDLPSSGTVIQSRTIIVSLVVGILVTVLASLAPALRATRVPPVAALREGVALPETRSSRFVFPLSIFLTSGGIVLLAMGLFSSDTTTALSLAGAGAAALFIGVGLLSPRLVTPLASLVGRPLEGGFGLTGRLARENSVRQPSRTAATAAALMIGVALVAFASIFAAGTKKTFDGYIDNGLKGQLVMQNQSGFGPFSANAAAAVAKVPGVDEVSPLRGAETRVSGVSGKKHVAGIDPRTFNDLYHVDVKKGPADLLSALKDDQVVVNKSYAEDNHTKLGDRLTLKTPGAGSVTLAVAGVVDDKSGILAPLTTTNARLRDSFKVSNDEYVVGGYSRGADPKAVKRSVDALLLKDFPQVEALTADEFKKFNRDQIDQLLNLIYGLLALSIIVSLFGIVNTLGLSITERTRELGMLRAIGTSRRQVKRMIRLESVITSMIGGILGLAIGIVLALLVTSTIDDFTLVVPVGSLIVVLIASAIAGVLAAIVPARRAARLDVLDALAYE